MFTTKNGLIHIPSWIICPLRTENNYNYKVNVQIKNQKYETKYYKDKIIEGGKYKTLVIMIGEGAGNNYWSILYPEYYGIGFEEVNTGNVTYKIWLFEKIKEWLD